MKSVHLIYNPGAGEQTYSLQELIDLIEANGFQCRYSSTKEENWEDFAPQTDFLVVAGGDGTISKTAKQLLKRHKAGEKTWPVAVLPLGTANNIAKTLGIEGDVRNIIQSWHAFRLKKYDVGTLEGIDETSFFLESFGYGVFPYLMMEMDKLEEDETATPEQNLEAALKLMKKIILSYEPHYCELKVDGSDHSGKFLLAEVMNIRSIGPNLYLSPYSDPGDAEFEVVLVPEKHKEKFAEYVAGKIQGLEETFSYHTLKGKKIKISWEGTHVHVDDKIVKLKKNETVRIRLEEHLLDFVVPEIKEVKNDGA